MFDLASVADSLSLKWDDQMVLEYRFPAGGPRTYVHPLRLPGSPSLTMDSPGDHAHHQGLWVGWKKVNGVDFWAPPGPVEDQTGYGRISHRRVLEQSASEEQARFIVENVWTDWRGVQHLTETRETIVAAPVDGYMVMDMRLRYVPDEGDVTLDLDRGEPGREGLFYSGLMVRFHSAITPGRFLDADGRTEPKDVFGSASRWCGFAGRHQEDGQVYGLTILDHPDNPRHPTPWWVRNREDYCILHPSPCYHEPFRLAPGDKLDLQYRLVLHRGYVDPSLIEDAGW